MTSAEYVRRERANELAFFQRAEKYFAQEVKKMAQAGEEETERCQKYQKILAEVRAIIAQRTAREQGAKIRGDK